MQTMSSERRYTRPVDVVSSGEQDRLVNRVPQRRHVGEGGLAWAAAWRCWPRPEMTTSPRSSRGTILLWTIFFSNLLILYFLINWLPVLLEQAGLPIERAVIGVAALNAGGIAGGLALGGLSDRTSATRVLHFAYAAAAAFVAALGLMATNHLGAVMTLIFLTGFFVIGSQFCMNALAAAYYPTAIRSTGVGWALGIGRIGSVIGPVVGGWFIGAGFDTSSIFLAAAVPAAIAAFCVFLLGLRRGRQDSTVAVKALVH